MLLTGNRRPSCFRVFWLPVLVREGKARRFNHCCGSFDEIMLACDANHQLPAHTKVILTFLVSARAARLRRFAKPSRTCTFLTCALGELDNEMFIYTLRV